MSRWIFASFLLTMFFLSSCGQNSARRINGNVKIGTKLYKIVSITLNDESVKCLIPADSSVTVIPANTTYQSGKVTETTIVVP